MPYVSFANRMQTRGSSPLSEEIERGLVMILSPRALAENGATCSDNKSLEEMKFNHYFLCIEKTDKTSRWVPLFSRSARYRQVHVPRAGRTGDLKFLTGKFFINVNNVWNVTNEAVFKAADAALDRSSKGNRNWIKSDRLFIW